ncbi:tRNA uridine-5-carboxymethylaminomethyl(34) synthesis GTPase MnmE [Desulfonatronospira sp.]|uniref:tRNA uridine-5-carboxymethylaminomethyl(34) synthesis GTPase MnmE n=1 Tax=Desulfonatronospira sp. TaxID=1962951 RepID=UPI0025BB3A28|nr:tRNA uridine-5-carboxymethylaminomethyl(34) synthesis GTPase MnmE [Desulfonatronospira sp.]
MPAAGDASRACGSTIAAIATPMGQGGVGIVRLSGPASLDIAEKLFVPGPRFKGFKAYKLHYGWIKNTQQQILDEVLLAYMPAPYSYTREDVVEINCHGGPAVLEGVLEALYHQGAEPAAPGEFTKRAFLNNRMDLTQAEAALEMINAPTQEGALLAGDKLQGHLKERVNFLRESLEELKKELCLAVDFPEEDLECLPLDDLANRATAAVQEIDELIRAFEQNRVFREGALVVLAGRVNAGKSSLMNALLGRQRAIVTSIPGTTRDYLEETLNLEGLPVRLVDTAGRRPTRDKIEMMGLETGRQLISRADLCILVLDASLQPAADDLDILEEVSPAKLVLAVNKQDLVRGTPGWVQDLKDKGLQLVHTSATLGQGLEELTTAVRFRILEEKRPEPTSSVAPNLRQKTALEKSRRELLLLAEEARQEVPHDVLGVRLDYACTFLDEITGRIVTEDILNSIFENFCIGK